MSCSRYHRIASPVCRWNNFNGELSHGRRRRRRRRRSGNDSHTVLYREIKLSILQDRWGLRCMAIPWIKVIPELKWMFQDPCLRVSLVQGTRTVCIQRRVTPARRAPGGTPCHPPSRLQVSEGKKKSYMTFSCLPCRAWQRTVCSCGQVTRNKCVSSLVPFPW